jgi:hypothetical protein
VAWALRGLLESHGFDLTAPIHVQRPLDQGFHLMQ